MRDAPRRRRAWLQRRPHRSRPGQRPDRTVGMLFGWLEDLWQHLLGVRIGSAPLAPLVRDHYALLADAAGEPERQCLLADQLPDQRVEGLIVHPLDPSDERR
jgi:LacI family transcriptional regulator